NVHGGLLARRARAGDRAALAKHGITPIDLVAVNLYPFRETVAKPGVGFEQAIEQIDIGGPSMLRSAAKNHQDVIVVVDPDDYPVVIAGLKAGELTPGASPGSPGNTELRKDLAAKVFAHTAAYDAAIHGYLTKDAPGRSPREAYERAFATDRTSAFGCVIALNVAVDRGAAEAMRDLFVEVVVAPAFADDALSVFRDKKNLRVVRLPAGDAAGWDYK